MSDPEFWKMYFEVLLEVSTFLVLLTGLLGLVIPIFPGLTVMWIATLVYAIIQAVAGNMFWGSWLIFAVITLLMIGGNIVDNIIIARKMRDQFIPWSSILIAFAAGIVVSVFFTPLVGLIAAPLGLFLAEMRRLNNRDEAIKSTKAYMIGWGWAFGARFIIGITMIGSWMLWAWI